ncbi:MAG: ABC transporter substrate-binding protein [Myxococcales bacterium]|nr:ABC transporter substrate-binding protein [Myxococcales bacterium]
MRRLLITWLLGLLGVTPASGSARAEARPGYGGVAVGPLGSRVYTIDPAQATRPGELTLVALVFDAPFAVDAASRVRPRLAVGLETIDALRARLVLRPGLKFHDGKALTAADVATSLQRAARLPGGWTLAPIKAARAIADDTVEIELTRPAPDLSLLLASPAASVTPGGQAPLHRVTGSGPFRFTEWDARVVKLAANPLCGEGRPFLDTLQLRYFGSRAEEAGSYEVGSSQISLHGATAFEGGAPKHRTVVVDGPRTVTSALAFGRGFADPALVKPPGVPKSGLPDDPALRRAIAGVIDRERVRRLAVRQPAIAATGLVPGAGKPVDRARAREDLARLLAGGAGAASRLRASLLLDASRFDDRDVADKLLADLSDVGIDLTVDAVDPKAFQERLDSGRYDLAIIEVPGHADPGLAALALLAAVDPRAARGLLARAPADPVTVERAVAERVVLTPLFHRSVRAHLRADLVGITVDAAGRIDYAAAWWAK